MDERVKHRLTGLVVLVSIAIIFVPAMVKKSTQRLGEKINVAVILPMKPTLPRVTVVNEKKVFDAVKVAKVDPVSQVLPLRSEIARVKVPAKRILLSQVPAVAMLKKPLAPPPVPEAPATLPQRIAPLGLHRVEAIKEGGYTIQLASFAQRQNAELLVKRLRGYGHHASYSESHSRQGHVFKVTVGPMTRRDEALLLRQKIAEQLQLKGFLVKTVVG